MSRRVPRRVPSTWDNPGKPLATINESVLPSPWCLFVPADAGPKVGAFYRARTLAESMTREELVEAFADALERAERAEAAQEEAEDKADEAQKEAKELEEQAEEADELKDAAEERDKAIKQRDDAEYKLQRVREVLGL